MCGRLTTPEDWSDVRITLRIDSLQIPLDFGAADVKPTDDAPIVFERDDGSRIAVLASFGFDAPKLGKLVINAKTETVHEKPMWSRALRERRCLVMASGFHEWTGPKKARVPHLVTLRGREPFTLAGLYRAEPRPNGATSYAFVILTAPAGPVIAPMHDREPVIVPPDARDAWLGGADAVAVLKRVVAERISSTDALVHEVLTDAKLKTETPPRQGSLF